MARKSKTPEGNDREPLRLRLSQESILIIGGVITLLVGFNFDRCNNRELTDYRLKAIEERLGKLDDRQDETSEEIENVNDRIDDVEAKMLPASR